MNYKYTTALTVCLFILANALTALAGSTSGNSNVCDPEIINQIQKGKSSKADVKQLMGDPDKIEGALNQDELWKYTYKVTTHSGSGRAFSSSGKDRQHGGRTSMDQKSCHLFVYFEKNGIVRKVSKSKVSGSSSFMN